MAHKPGFTGFKIVKTGRLSRFSTTRIYGNSFVLFFNILSWKVLYA